MNVLTTIDAGAWLSKYLDCADGDQDLARTRLAAFAEALMSAQATNAEGKREIVGFDIVTTENTPAWTAFLRSLVARGLTGVELVISDAHGGIKAAIGTILANVSWQRCRTHFMANLASLVPKTDWPMVSTLVRQIFLQPDRESTWAQLADLVTKLTEAGFVDVAAYLLDAADDILAFTAFRIEHWPKIRSNNPQERLNKEIRRRTDVVGIFPNRQAVIRLGRSPPRRADRRVGHCPALRQHRVPQDPPGRRTGSERPEAGHRDHRRLIAFTDTGRKPFDTTT